MERIEELKLDLESIEDNIEIAHIRIKETKEKMEWWSASYNFWKEEIERRYSQRDDIEELIYLLENKTLNN